MAPPSPNLAPAMRPRFSLPLGQRSAWMGIAILATLFVLAGTASADSPDDLAKAKPKVRHHQSLVPPTTSRHPTLLPQTRYTVRKQIESIEPISWLERFGKVRVREIKR